MAKNPYSQEDRDFVNDEWLLHSRLLAWGFNNHVLVYLSMILANSGTASSTFCLAEPRTLL